MNQSRNINIVQKSLFTLCMEKLASTHNKDLHKKIPTIVYNDFVKYLMERGYYNWKSKINLVNLEINVEDIQVDQDMYFDEITYHIFVKKKIDDSEDHENELDYDSEYILYHEYRDDPIIYNNYLQIAKKRGLIFNYEDYIENISEYLNMNYDLQE